MNIGHFRLSDYYCDVNWCLR